MVVTQVNSMRLRPWQVVTVAMGFVAQSHAGLQLTPFASARVEHDDNVFRVQDAAAARAARGDSQRSDTISTYVAGANLNYSAGLQTVFLSGSANTVKYDQFDTLDYDGSAIDGGMNWQLGASLKGDLRLGRTQGLQDFSLQGSTTDRNISKTTTGSGSASLRVLNDYELSGRASGIRRRNSSDNQILQDLDETTGGLGFSRVSIDRAIGVEALYGSGEYIEREPGVGVIEDYDQSTYQLIGRWNPSSITNLTYNAGFARRENHGMDVEDEDGFVGALTISRSVSVKTTVYAGANRSFASPQQQGESTALVTGVYAGGSWAPSPKVTVGGNYYFSRNDFRRASETVPPREDDYQGISLNCAYTPREWIVLTPAVAWESRSSDRAGSDYDDYRISLELQLRYPLIR